MAHKPSKRQIRTLRFVADFLSLHGAPPTMQEIAENFGIKRSSVYQQIVLLEKHGLIERSGRGKSRNIRIRPGALDQMAPPRDVHEIAVRGLVPAGRPFLAEDNVLGHLQVDEALAKRGKLFALEVRGDSMVNAGIRCGDFVVVRHQAVAESGDIVVVLLDGEGTVKRLHIEVDKIELRPENGKYKPVVVGQDRDLQIVGKVVSVQRVRRGPRR